MTGYITLYKPDLKFRDYYRYREYYCGLCRALGKRYGQSSRFTLGYDMTFLAILLDGVYDGPSAEPEFRCPLHPFEKRRARQNPFLDYVADMNLYMAGLKCRDDWQDDRNPVRGICALLLSRRMKSIEEKYSEKTSRIKAALNELSCYEKEQSTDFEGAAGCFGRAAAELFRFGGVWDDTMAGLGFYLGKFIYLLDAYEDLEEDLKKNRYNPFYQSGSEDEFDVRIKEILGTMISRSADEFEMLPVDENLDILRNILYAGAWKRYEEIAYRKTVR